MAAEADEAVVVDTRGHRCPIPTLRLGRALRHHALVRLIADDPLARIDVPHFVSEGGHRLIGLEEAGPDLAFTVARNAMAPTG